MPMPTLYHAFIYYGTLAVFGVVALAFNVVCLLLGWLPARPAVERFFQRAIHRLFVALGAWLRFTRTIQLEYDGFERRPRGGCVLVANHPGLLDAFFLLGRLPDAVCVFKRSIRRNPILGAAARRAGYIANDRGINLVRSAIRHAREGATVIVFPEGTRTRLGGAVRPFKPGFALIARRAGVPVQLVRIACDSNLLPKERAWWKLTHLPARIVVRAGPCLEPRAAGSTAALAAQVEAWFRDAPAPLNIAPREKIFADAPPPEVINAA